QRQDRAVVAATPAAQVEVEFVGEDVEGAGDEAGGSVRVTASAAATDHLQPAAKRRAIAALTPCEAAECARDRTQPVYARAALPGALPGEVPHDARGFDYAACPSRQSDDRAG